MKFRSAVVDDYDIKCFKNIEFSHPELPVYKMCVLGAKFNNFIKTDEKGLVLSITLPEFYESTFFDGITHNDIICFIQESLANFIRSDDVVFNVSVIYDIANNKTWTKEKFLSVNDDWENGKFNSRTKKPKYQKEWAYSHPDIRDGSLIDFYRFLLAGKYNML